MVLNSSTSDLDTVIIGQKNDVEVYFQLFSNTISEHMWETIIRKEMNIDKVIKTENNK